MIQYSGQNVRRTLDEKSSRFDRSLGKRSHHFPSVVLPKNKPLLLFDNSFNKCPFLSSRNVWEVGWLSNENTARVNSKKYKV